MKKSVLFSTIASTLFLAGTLKAGGFLDGATQVDCSQYRGAQREHCNDLNANLQACFDHSTDSGQIEHKECIHEAYAAHVAAMRGGPLQPDSESMVSDPIVTELADSSYGNPQRDKGYKFAHEGD